jgi:hypothetical protein
VCTPGVASPLCILLRVFRLYAAVIVIEVIVLSALWALGVYFR